MIDKMPVFREQFEANRGVRFYCCQRSILLQAMAITKDLPISHLNNIAFRLNRFLDDVGNLPRRENRQRPALTKLDFPDCSNGRFLKFVSEEGWSHIRQGSFLFGTPTHYRGIENLQRRDAHEGVSFFHLTSTPYQFHAAMTAGYNCFMFCGTNVQDQSGQEHMATRFGSRILRIDDIAGFAERARTVVGARNVIVRDVVYTDTKNFHGQFDGIDNLVGTSGLGNLSREILHEMNGRFFQTFYELALLPSLFSKPFAYFTEREKRLVFEMDADTLAPTIVVEDKKLLDYITVTDICSI
jgi:hypothetical protein